VSYDLSAQHGVVAAIQRKAAEELWDKLGTRRRNYQGLKGGRNDQATLAWIKQTEEERTSLS